MSGTALAEASEQLIGTRFRLHGRDPATGLDCVGVLSAALAAIGLPAAFPSGYRIRTGWFAQIPNLAHAHGFVPVAGAILPGDVLFTRPGPSQLHLLIGATKHGFFTEAHAGLGRVVLTPGPLADPILHQWRLAPRP